jgi:hypothetical protein
MIAIADHDSAPFGKVVQKGRQGFARMPGGRDRARMTQSQLIDVLIARLELSLEHQLRS